VPELPEVETIRRHLAPHVEGRRITAIEVGDPRWSRPLAPSELEDALRGRTIERLNRRGKYLIWELTDEVYLLQHLRMTGTVLIEPDPPPTHGRVRMDLDGLNVVISDPRRFGTGELALGEDARDAFLDARLGLEPFEPEFTAAHLAALAARTRAPVKAFILDQTRIAGVGNIYADEALFRARIHPLRPANRLDAGQIAALREAIIESLQAGIDAKGATIDDFRDPYGVSGTFQDRFLVHTREGLPCPNCGTAIRKLRAAGRGTYVCERCQPKPRGPGRADDRRGPRAKAPDSRR
jgi:formamidopyrimidine-DNA glycosylase